MGALVTLELAEDSPALRLPWIITFGPLSDKEEWEPIVCGPYERPHALALAESVVADENLMAVVEPLLPRVSVDEIRDEIASARRTAEEETAELNGDSDYPDLVEEESEGLFGQHREPSAPPSPADVRAGLARIAAQLTAS